MTKVDYLLSNYSQNYNEKKAIWIGKIFHFWTSTSDVLKKSVQIKVWKNFSRLVVQATNGRLQIRYDLSQMKVGLYKNRQGSYVVSNWNSKQQPTEPTISNKSVTLMNTCKLYNKNFQEIGNIPFHLIMLIKVFY